MRHWGRRIRGALKMGLVWAFVWSFAGAVLARVPGYESGDLPYPLLFAPLGFLTGVIFAGILVGAEGGRGFARLSLPRFAVWGVAAGLLLTGTFVVGAALRGASVVAEFLTFGPALTVASAVCAAGSLAVARRAERRALGGAGDDPDGGALSEAERRELLGRGD